MELNNSNDLENKREENNIVQNFINDLKEFINKQESKLNNIEPMKKDTSLIEELQSQGKITAMYRDKINVERVKILQNIANRNENKDTMYFVYHKNKEDGTYNLSACEQDKSHEVITVDEKKLPSNIGVDSVLRKDNNGYVLDKNLTKEVQYDIQNMVNKLLEEQKKYLEQNRIEGHIYSFNGKTDNSIWLVDETKYGQINNKSIFEEIEFPKDILKSAKYGDLYQYRNGKYYILEK